MSTLNEIITPQELITFTNELQTTDYLGETLFPSVKVPSFSFRDIRTGNSVPVVASVSALDAEAEIASREGRMTDMELAYIKRKIRLSEENLLTLKAPGFQQQAQMALRAIFNDTEHMVNSVKARIEAMRMEVLTTGKITLDENGIKTEVDYLMKSENQKKADWSTETADPIADIMDWVLEADVEPDIMLMNGLTAQNILNTVAIQTKFEKSNAMATLTGLNDYLTAAGLPTIQVYNKAYRKQLANGKYEKHRFVKDGNIALIPSGSLGSTVFGMTPEESRLITNGTLEGNVGNIHTMIYESNQDPIATWTKASATAMPSFTEADNVIQATVKLAKK
ncbi:major capsid protein [Carnobacterium divergens]|uniref:major capsid protein n=1 Tax=Carnobacterium divergens TaxID=2748 RepID=UPI0039C9D241